MAKVQEYERIADGGQPSLINSPFSAVGNEEKIVRDKQAPSLLRSEQNLKNINEIRNNIQSISVGMLKYADSIDEAEKNKALNLYRAKLSTLNDKLRNDYKGINTKDLITEYAKENDAILNEIDIPYRKRKEFQLQAESVSLGVRDSLIDYTRNEIDREKKEQFNATLKNNILDIQQAPTNTELFKNKLLDGFTQIDEWGKTEGNEPEVIADARLKYSTNAYMTRINSFVASRNVSQAREALELARTEKGMDPDSFAKSEDAVNKLEFQFKAHNISIGALNSVVKEGKSESEAFKNILTLAAKDPALLDAARDSFVTYMKDYKDIVYKAENNILEYNNAYGRTYNGMVNIKNTEDAMSFIDRETDVFGIHKEAIATNLREIWYNKRSGTDSSIDDDQNIISQIRKEQFQNGGNSLTLLTMSHKLKSETRQRLIEAGIELAKNSKKGDGGSDTGSSNALSLSNTVAVGEATYMIKKSLGLINKDNEPSGDYEEKSPLVEAEINSVVKSLVEDQKFEKLTDKIIFDAYLDMKHSSKWLEKSLESINMTIDKLSRYTFGVPVNKLENPEALFYSMNNNFKVWAATTKGIDKMSESEKYDSLNSYLSQTSSDYLALKKRTMGKYDLIFEEDRLAQKTLPKTVMYGHEVMEYPVKNTKIDLSPNVDVLLNNKVKGMYPEVLNDIGEDNFNDIMLKANNSILSKQYGYSSSELLANNIIDEFNTLSYSQDIDNLFYNGKIVTDIDVDSTATFFTSDSARNSTINMTKWISPIGQNSVNRITSPFMPQGRINPVTGVFRPHRGVDIAVPEDTDVLSTHDGIVISSGYGEEEGNFIVVLNEELGIKTHYYHLNSIPENIKEGTQIIAQNTIIGKSGSTGTSTGPHLHYGMQVKDDRGKWVYVNPLEQEGIVSEEVSTTPEQQEQPKKIESISPFSETGDLKTDVFINAISTLDNINLVKPILTNPTVPNGIDQFKGFVKNPSFTNTVNQIVNSFKTGGIGGVKYKISRGSPVYSTISGYIVDKGGDISSNSIMITDQNNGIKVHYDNVKLSNKYKSSDSNYIAVGDIIGYVNKIVDEDGYNLIYSVTR